MTLQEKLIAAGAIKVSEPKIISIDEGANSLKELNPQETRRELFKEIKYEINNIKEFAPNANSSSGEFTSPLENKDIGFVNSTNEQSGASTANREIASDLKGVIAGFEEPEELNGFAKGNKVIGFVNSTNETNREIASDLNDIGFVNSSNAPSEATNRNKPLTPPPAANSQVDDGLLKLECDKVQVDFFDNGPGRGKSQYLAKFHVTVDATTGRKVTLSACFYSRNRDYAANLTRRGVIDDFFYSRFMDKVEDVYEREAAGLLKPNEEFKIRLAILNEAVLNPMTGKTEFEALENSSAILYWNAADDSPTIEVYIEGWGNTFKLDYKFDRKKQSNLKFMGMYRNPALAEQETKQRPMKRLTASW